MLCVKPCTDIEFKEQVLSTLGYNADSAELLTAEENGRLLGYAAVKQLGQNLEILRLSIMSCTDYSSPTEEDSEIAEYLVRAAANYAYNRMLTTLSCSLPEFSTILLRLGFDKVDNLCEINIKKLFNSCKNCK